MSEHESVCVVVLAAGQGTRMRSELPKVMHPVLGRPMVGGIVEQARALGADFAVAVVGYGREIVEAYLREVEARGEMPIHFALQEEQLGTGHATRQALGALEGFEGWVLVLNGDLPNLRAELLAGLVEGTRASGGQMGLVSMRVEDPTGYGRIVRDGDGAVQAIVEHRDCAPGQLAIDEVNAGVYLFRADFLRGKLQEVRSDNAQGEFYLTDLVAMSAQGDGCFALVAPEPRVVMGVNDRSQLSEAEAFAQAELNAAWMRDGVTMQDPRTTWVSFDVTLSRDVELGAGVHLRGATTIGEGARVDTGCVLEDAVVGRGAELGANCVVQGATVEVGAVVPPLTLLQPENAS